MSDDTHPAIRHCASLDGHSEKEDIDHDGFATYQQLKFVVSPPAHRMDALNQIDAQISQNSGTLRQKSELVDLRRRLSRTHESLLKAGR
jgi:hypothetical protein